MTKPYYITVTSYFPTPTSWRCAFVYDQVRAIQRTGRYRVIVINTMNKGDYEYHGVQVYSIKCERRGSAFLGPIYDRINTNRLVACLQSHGISPNDIAVVHMHLVSNGFATFIKKFNPNIKALIQLHDPDPCGTMLSNDTHALFGLKRICCYLHHRSHLERADALVAISRNVQNVAETFPHQTVMCDYAPMQRSMHECRFCRSPRIKHFILLHNGVDTTVFHPQVPNPTNSTIHNSSFIVPNSLTIGCVGNFTDSKDQLSLLKAMLNLRGGGGIIGCIGNFIDWKNQITLLQAIVLLRKELSMNFKVVFIGSGDCLEQCKSFVRENGLDDYVTFLTEMDHSKLPDFYRSLDLFVLPSYFEGFGCVLTEAWTCGAPFITCEGQGIEDMILPEERKLWLCKQRDPQDLAAKIAYYFEHRPIQHMAAETDINKLIPKFLDEVEAL